MQFGNFHKILKQFLIVVVLMKQVGCIFVGSWPQKRRKLTNSSETRMTKTDFKISRKTKVSLFTQLHWHQISPNYPNSVLKNSHKTLIATPCCFIPSKKTINSLDKEQYDKGLMTSHFLYDCFIYTQFDLLFQHFFQLSM